MSDEKPRILLVDDVSSHRLLVRRALEAEGLQCTLESAATGRDCLEALARAPFDILLLDFCLPDTDGLAVLREVRARYPALNVVVVTGMGSEEVAVDAMKLGARDYVVKSNDLVRRVPLAVRKILERLALEAELRETRREKCRLEELDRMQQEFLARVSHELRTPLVSMVGYGELLLSGDMGPLTPAQRQALEVSLRNAHRQRSTIESLLLYAGIQAHRRPLDRSAFTLQSSLSQAIDSFRPECEKKGVTLRSLLPAVPIGVFADEALIGHVLTNLVGNAVKFTPNGGEIEVRCDVEGGGWAAVQVSDTGCGIPLEAQPHIFERFWQADGSLTRRHGGLGLGLAIVKEILDAHGCPIRCESEPGKGARLLFHLPLAERPASSRTDSTRRRRARLLRRGEGRRILVIDDEPDIRDFMKTLLSATGYEVYTAGDATRGIDLAQSLPFDLVLLDIALPDRDGVSLMRELREGPRTRHLTVWMLSARADAPTRQRALKAGADGFVTKPFVPDDLLYALSNFLAKSPAAK
ncbi:MAG: response regulator [Planctomycetes bacterium]|nr:response regulator [Planctomycetota bacterium]